MDLSGWVPPEAWVILVLGVVVVLLVGYELGGFLLHHFTLHVTYR